MYDWIHDDICWCMSECDNIECFRNIANRKHKTGLFTAAMLKDTDDCPYKKDSVKEFIIKISTDILEEEFDEPKLQELIRCKDCQFYNEGSNEVDAWMRCRLHSINTDPLEYCSWAVRK